MRELVETPVQTKVPVRGSKPTLDWGGDSESGFDGEGEPTVQTGEKPELRKQNNGGRRKEILFKVSFKTGEVFTTYKRDVGPNKCEGNTRKRWHVGP